MTKAIFKFSDDLFQEVEISGHAGYQEKGLDIVCSGISATTISTFNLIEKLLNDQCEISEDEKKGILKLRIVNYDTIDTEDNYFLHLIVENFIDSLQEIEANYPNHLKVKIEK